MLFIPDDAVECVAVRWLKVRVREGGTSILREREGGSELILTLLEGDLSNFSFGEAHFRTPTPFLVIVRLSRQLVLPSKSRRCLDANYEIFNKSRPPTTSSLQVQKRFKRLVFKSANTLWNVPCNLSRNVLATLAFGILCCLSTKYSRDWQNVTTSYSQKLLKYHSPHKITEIFLLRSSWRRQQPCLRQLRPRPLALKSRTRTRIWRSLIIAQSLTIEGENCGYVLLNFWLQMRKKN